ncbi:hypothetical protein BD410DRAFT_797109 [Rickenella mellea]|uniref:GTP cyclohydrolase N-terminal domain-containing protein n=1 Tax=Rickenella mellea TaxID=50990 RepID=A0A4Y7PGZ2_9AGAM|nr:hypothetical protein BD410DRAFT_797109 [Rickenella mellea]
MNGITADQHAYPLQWGASDPKLRGPIICSRLPSSIKQRNAISAHSGSSSIYRALAMVLCTLSTTHKPSYALINLPCPSLLDSHGPTPEERLVRPMRTPRAPNIPR